MGYNIEKINAKLKLMGYQYLITADYGIRLTRRDFEEINIVEPVRYIPDNTFEGMEELRSVKLPTTIEIIGASAFELCKNLSYIELHDNITTVDDKAFYSCVNLNLNKLPKSLLI